MLRVFTAFSGYDSQCLALERIGIDYELVGWSEIDKFAIKAHNALFPMWSDRNYGDISKINWNEVPDFDLFTYSSPCQDFSTAGKMRGGEKGSGTRSSLLWDCERAIRAKLPTYLLMENVAALVSKRFIGTFNQWLDVLSSLGYTNYWQVLNAKDYGVPQNRKRVFVVSIFNSQEQYYFPKPVQTDIKLKDVLEGYVDERYYLSDEAVKKMVHEDTVCTIRTNTNTANHNFIIKKIGRVHKGMNGVVYGTDGVAPTVTTNHGEGNKIAIRYPVVLGWTRDSKGKVINRHPVEICNTITSSKRDNTQNYVVDQEYRIRKLTERECFRLMGVNDTDSDKIREVVSKSQCYKLAGNSIVVDVLVAIFNQLFSDNKTSDRQLKLF